MSEKPSFEALEQRVRELEKKATPTDFEVALSESRELFEKTFMSQKDAIFILNSLVPPRIFNCNPAAEKTFGYSRQEMLGRDTKFLHVSEEALAEFQKKLYPTIAEQGFFYLNDFVMKRKDGTLFPGEHMVVPLNNERGERIGWTSVVRDITSQKQMEEAIRKSNERYQLLADNVSDVIFIRDMDFRFTYLSPSIVKMTGYSVEEAMSLTLSEAYTTHSIEVAMQALSEELSKEGGGQSDPDRVRTIEMEGFRKDGSRIWTEARMRFLRDPNGHPIGILGVSRDITKRKRTEEALLENDIRFNKLSSQVPGMIYQFMKRPDGTYCIPFTTESIRDIFGCSPQDVREDFSPIARAILPEDLDKVIGSIESSAQRMTVWECEYRVQIPGRPVRWMFGQSTPEKLVDGSIIWHGFNTDITDRKQMEEAIKESEKRFKFLTEAMADIVWTMDQNFHTTYVSPSIERVLGFTPEERKRQSLEEMVTPESVRTIRAMLEKELEIENQGRGDPDRSITIEVEFYHKNGSTVWLENNVKAIRDSEGKMIGMHGVSRDITERKEAVEALRKSEIHYRSLFDNSLDAFLLTAPNGSILDANPAACKMFGRTVEEIKELGRNGLVDLTDPRLQKALEERARTGKTRAEITMVRADQTKFPAGITSTVFTDQSGLKRTIMIIRDITARKRAEEALRESEKRYKQLFNHAPAGIYELDFNEQRFIAVNDIMCKYAGYGEEEFLTMSPYDILSKEGQALYAQRCKKLAAGEKISESVEYKIITKSGGEMWVALNISPVYENGKVKGVTVVVHNVTERRKVEQKVRQSEKRLRSLSAELMKAQEKERTRISKELHDELGQSLAILKHRVRSIGKKLAAYQPHTSHDNHGAVELVDEIIQKVRQISRDLNPSVLEDVGLCPALRSLVDNFMQEYEISTSLDIDEIDALFSKETARDLYRIVQEALTNIAKHAGASHVILHISKGPEYVYFVIEDDGKGFDTSEAKARAENRRGLGLPLMEERADLIGGTLEITNREDTGGTKILLTVPIEIGSIH
jgi:PAS domain S-box-containing protein